MEEVKYEFRVPWKNLYSKTYDNGARFYKPRVSLFKIYYLLHTVSIVVTPEIEVESSFLAVSFRFIK